jgi:hypothetical protein
MLGLAGLLLVGWAALSSHEVAAEEDGSAIPPSVHAALLAKIIQFDTTLRSSDMDTVKVGFVASARGQTLLKGVMEAFKPVGIPTVLVNPSELGQVRGLKVVFVPADAPLDQVTPFCAQHGVLSIGVVPQSVEDGAVAIGIVLSNGKPAVLVNLKRVAAEQHVLVADFFRLARVVGK